MFRKRDVVSSSLSYAAFMSVFVVLNFFFPTRHVRVPNLSRCSFQLCVGVVVWGGGRMPNCLSSVHRAKVNRTRLCLMQNASNLDISFFLSFSCSHFPVHQLLLFGSLSISSVGFVSVLSPPYLPTYLHPRRVHFVRGVMAANWSVVSVVFHTLFFFWLCGIVDFHECRSALPPSLSLVLH